VVVHAPGQYLGDLTRDVSRRRGEILDTSLDKGRCMLHAYVPLAELFGYTSELRNFTSGTASFSMEPSHYAPVKEELADLRVASYIAEISMDLQGAPMQIGVPFAFLISWRWRWP